MLRGSWKRLAAAAAIAVTLGACASTIARVPLPEAELPRASALAGSDKEYRFWGDEHLPGIDSAMASSAEELRQRAPDVFGRPHHYLALSGGGENGAFGAGLLAGWTASGKRPVFTYVTGVSTGALIAPFAFLGPAYDSHLTAIYTQYSTHDLVRQRSFFGMVSAVSAVDPTPMRNLVAKYINDDLVAAIAEQHARGRRLVIGTTNLDASRPVMWDIGAIASSNHPRKVELIREVLLASASVPGIFPPVLIKVDAGGRTFDELHVDGGTTNQVFIYPSGTNWRAFMRKLQVPGKPNLYVVRNASLTPRYDPVEARLLPIAGRSISALIRTQGIGDLYRIYTSSQRDNLDFNLAFIPQEFDAQSSEAFDTKFMRKLYDLGYQQGRAGGGWHKQPPGL